MFYIKSFGRFFYRFVLETPNIFCLYIDCLYIIYIEKIGFKKKKFFFPTFAMKFQELFSDFPQYLSNCLSELNDVLKFVNVLMAFGGDID